MTKDRASLAFTLLSYYSTKYKARYNKQPNINKYKEKWAAADILDDFSLDEAKNIIDYYFTLSKDGHPLNWLFNNFDKLKQTMNDNAEDKRLRAERRKQLAKMREEWLNGNA